MWPWIWISKKNYCSHEQYRGGIVHREQYCGYFSSKKMCLSPSSFKSLAVIKCCLIYCLSLLTFVESSDGVVGYFCYSCRSLLLPINFTSTAGTITLSLRISQNFSYWVRGSLKTSHSTLSLGNSKILFVFKTVMNINFFARRFGLIGNFSIDIENSTVT